MFAIIIGLIVIALVVTLLLKGYYPQAILFMGGVVLLTCTAIFGWGDLLNAKQTTNFIGFDIFKVFSTGFSSRIAGLGLTLMAIGGFSRYMEHVGASAALFSVFEKPLKLIKSPYVLLGASFLVSQIMVIFVPSHAGLALLLMVTLYPILIRSGVSPMSALGVIGCAQFVDVGPGSGNAILAAQTMRLLPQICGILHPTAQIPAASSPKSLSRPVWDLLPYTAEVLLILPVTDLHKAPHTASPDGCRAVAAEALPYAFHFRSKAAAPLTSAVHDNAACSLC